MIFNSSKKDNNCSDFIVNNHFPKNEEQNKIRNKTIFKDFLYKNNNSNSNISMNKNNINNNINNNKDTAQIKYQKLKIKKKNNNSFRINHIKNLFQGEKMNMIKKLYLAKNIERDRNESLNRKIDKNHFGKTYINMNSKIVAENSTQKKEVKFKNKIMSKMPVYFNNSSLGDNYDNYNSYKNNNISQQKLNNTNNDLNIKYANSLNNISYKDKNFNFNRIVPKLKSSEKNTIINRNYFYNKSRTNVNMKTKKFDRINSAGKFKSGKYELIKTNSINNKIKKYSKEKLWNKSNSNKKDKFQYYLLS